MAIVGDSDYEFLVQWKWHSMKNRWGVYAVRTRRKSDGPGSKFIYMHRVVAGTPEDKHCDHVNGQTLDNRPSNLRNANDRQNGWNQKKRAGVSKFMGVTWHSKTSKWVAWVRSGDKNKNLGYFSKEIEAAIRRDDASIEYYGEYARLNFPWIYA